jgi:TolA-binding protein
MGHYITAQEHIGNASSAQLYKEGLELMQQSNYGAARQVFERYIPIAEHTIHQQNATYYVAFCALSLYHKDGESLLTAFINKHPNHPKSAIAYYELGDFYYRQKKYKKAVIYFEKADFKALDLSERHAAYFKRGYAYFTQKKFDEAIKNFNEIKTQTGQYRAGASYYAGYIAYEQGAYAASLTDLKRAAQSDSYARLVPYMISNVYYKQQDYQSLQQYAEPLLQGNDNLSSKADVRLLVAEAYFHQGAYKKSNAYFADYNTKGKISPELSYRIGYAAYVSEEYNRAITSFKQVTGAKSTLMHQASYYLGILYIKENNKPFAITAFAQLLGDGVDMALKEEAVYQSAKLNYEVNRTHQAITMMRGYLLEFPNGKYRSTVSDLLTQAYFNENDYDEALKYIETLSARTTQVKQVYQKATFHKAIELFNKNQYARAVRMFDESLVYPLDTEYQLGAYFWKAEAYAIGKKYPEAAAAYQKVLWNQNSKGSQYQLKSRYGLGYAYFDNKEYDKALIQFYEYVEKGGINDSKSNHHDATIRLADCYYVSKQYVKAIQYYETSLPQSRVDNDYSYLHLGLINGIESNVTAANRAFDQVIRNHSRSKYYDDAVFNKAQLAFENGDYTRAISSFGMLIKNKPKSKYVPYAYMKRASAHYNNKAYGKSIADYEAIIDGFSKHSVAKEILLPLQEVLTLQGRSQDFDRYLAKYKAANPDGEGLENVEFEAAKGLYFNQEYAHAIDKFKTFQNAYKESNLLEDATYYIAESYYRTGAYEDALTNYNEVIKNEHYVQYHKVLGRIAELEFRQERYENAIYFYQQYADLARSKKHQYTALSGLMRSYYLINQYDSSRHHANSIISLGSVNAGSLNEASLYMAKSAMGHQDYQLAKDELLTTLNTAKDVYGAEAQYLLGKIQFIEKEYAKSIETLIALNTTFHAYDQWVGKGFLLIVDNYIAMDEMFQAKGTLQSIIEGFPLEQIVTEAKQKLLELEAGQAAQLLKIDSIEAVQDTLYTDQ